MFNINKYIDVNLLIIVLVLSAIGISVIASATDADVLGITREVKLQVISFTLGLVIMFAMLLVDYKWLGKVYWLIYALAIIALLLVYVPGLGIVLAEVRSWIDLRVMYFQTSEIAKLGFIISLAKFLDNRKSKLNSIVDIVGLVIFTLPFLILLYKQPDLGTMLIFVFIFIGMVFVAGIDFKIIILSMLTAIVTIPIAFPFLNGYQKKRIYAFFNPNDPTSDGYFQVRMSKIAIGSGRFSGSGLFKGGFTSNRYLPVQETDFIFAVLVEELGFIGGIVVIGLYFLMITRLLRIAFLTKDNFGVSIVIGVLFMFSFNIFENLGMTMGVMPVTGVPLPFISYGGSAMLINMIAIGLVMNVYMRNRAQKKEDDFTKMEKRM